MASLGHSEGRFCRFLPVRWPGAGCQGLWGASAGPDVSNGVNSPGAWASASKTRPVRIPLYRTIVRSGGAVIAMALRVASADRSR